VKTKPGIAQRLPRVTKTPSREEKKVKTDKNSEPALIPCQYNEKTRIPSELLFLEKLPLSVPCFASYTWVFFYTWSLIDS
jgi:hypothetical protein